MLDKEIIVEVYKTEYVKTALFSQVYIKITVHRELRLSLKMMYWKFSRQLAEKQKDSFHGNADTD